MLSSRMNIISLLLGVAAASPLPGSAPAAPASSPENSPMNAAQNVTLVPARAPHVDGKNLSNLLGTKDFLMHFDSDPNTDVASIVSTMTAAGVPRPIVQLEDTDYIKSINCSANAATIAFNSSAAYQTALQDWNQHDEFVLFSHDPKCGSGFDQNMRDYAVVKNITTHNETMTIEASVDFIDYGVAVGEATLVHMELGQSQAPNNTKRGLFGLPLSLPDLSPPKLPDLTHDISSNLKWFNYPTNDLTTQQFGSGYQLYKSQELDVICAGCGTSGALTFTSEIDFSLSNGIAKATAEMKGSVQAKMALGMVARGLKGKIPLPSVGLASVGLPPFEIPGIATFGPQIDLKAAASVLLEATGEMDIGTTLEWPDIDVKVGLMNDDTHQGTGLNPTTKPFFNASGEISATLDLALPIFVGVGIDIGNGKWNKQLALEDQPSFALTSEKGTPGNTSCSGVGLSGALENNIGANIVGVTSVGFASNTLPLFSTCLDAKPTNAPSSSKPAARSAETTPAAH